MTPQDPRIGDAAVPTPRIRQRPQPIALPNVAVPPAVAEALEADTRVIVEADEATDALRAARRNVGQAAKDDVLESADLVAAGKPPLPPGKRTEDKAQAKLREAEYRRDVAYTAGWSTRQQLATAIIANRDPWLDAVRAQEAEAAERYRAALADLRSAANTLKAARGAGAWLEHVDVDRGVLPDHVARGRLDVTIGGVNVPGSREYPATEVLAALALVANPPPETRMVSRTLDHQPNRVPA